MLSSPHFSNFPLAFYLSYYFRGFLMGVSDVLPGISGGTIALITGIYPMIINTLKKIDKKLILLLFSFAFYFVYDRKGKFLKTKKTLKKILQEVPFFSLFSVLLGILSAIIFMSNLIVYLLESYSFYLYSFFTGLLLATAYKFFLYVYQQRAKQNFTFSLLLLFAGLLLALVLLGSFFRVFGANGKITLIYIFISGIIGICTMVLPGISGSTVLIMLGVYETILQAIVDLNFLVLGTFLLGNILGLFSFIRLLDYLIKNHLLSLYACLSGFILGSVYNLYETEISLYLIFGSLSIWEQIFSPLSFITGFLLLYFFFSAEKSLNQKSLE